VNPRLSEPAEGVNCPKKHQRWFELSNEQFGAGAGSNKKHSKSSFPQGRKSLPVKPNETVSVMKQKTGHRFNPASEGETAREGGEGRVGRGAVFVLEKKKGNKQTLFKERGGKYESQVHP